MPLTEVVEDPDVMTGQSQAADRVAADVAGPTDDEDAHQDLPMNEGAPARAGAATNSDATHRGPARRAVVGPTVSEGPGPGPPCERLVTAPPTQSFWTDPEVLQGPSQPVGAVDLRLPAPQQSAGPGDVGFRRLGSSSGSSW